MMNEQYKKSCREIAKRLNEFCIDIDYYEYVDYVEDSRELIEELYQDIANGNIQYMLKWLAEIIEEDPYPEYVQRAEELRTQLKSFQQSLQSDFCLTNQ